MSVGKGPGFDFEDGKIIRRQEEDEKDVMVDGIANPAASFGCGFQMDGNRLTFGETVFFGKRVYDAADWPAFRASAMNQIKVSETPVILTK